MEEKKNDYIKFLKQLENERINVVTKNNSFFTGKCLAVNFNHLNIILMKDNGKIVVIKDISHAEEIDILTLKRSKNAKEQEDY